jgi:hypothetical protein
VSGVLAEIVAKTRSRLAAEPIDEAAATRAAHEAASQREPHAFERALRQPRYPHFEILVGKMLPSFQR